MHTYFKSHTLSEDEKRALGKSLYALYHFIQELHAHQPEIIEFYKNHWYVLMSIVAGLDMNHINAAIIHASKNAFTLYIKVPKGNGYRDEEMKKVFNFTSSNHAFMHLIKCCHGFEQSQKYTMMVTIFQSEYSPLMSNETVDTLLKNDDFKALLEI